MKKSAKPKMGKAAVRAQSQGQGKEVLKGRAAFARSVNVKSRFHWADWDHDSKDMIKAMKRQAWQRDITCDSLDCDEGVIWWWQDDATCAYEEGEEFDWAPIDSYVLSCMPKRITSTVERISVAKVSDLDRLAQRLKSCGAVLEKECFSKGIFVELQKQFLQQHGPNFCKELSNSVKRTIHVRPAPVSAEVQERFLDAQTVLPGALKPGYHGTNISNLPAIYEKGLLIPGQGNCLQVANGSAHGLGIYTATVQNPSLSWSFCRAPEPMDRKMMVCGILDDASQVTDDGYKMGVRTVTRESQNVRHVGDAMVIFDDRRVAPFFEVSIGETLERQLVSVLFDWSRWQRKVRLILNASPAKSSIRVPLMRSQVKQRTATAYLARRGARKRSSKSI